MNIFHVDIPFMMPMENTGRHCRFTMNRLMRNPEWNKGKRDCTIAQCVKDAADLNLERRLTGKSYYDGRNPFPVQRLWDVH